MTDIIKKLPLDLQKYIIYEFLLCSKCGERKHNIKKGNSFVYRSYFNGFFYAPISFIYVKKVKKEIAKCYIIKLKCANRNDYKKINYDICELNKLKKLRTLGFVFGK